MSTNEKEFNEYIDPIVDRLPLNLTYAEKLKLLKDRFQLPKDYLDLPNDPLTTSILQSTMEKARMAANNPKYDYESTGFWPSFKANKQGDKMIQQLEVEDPGLILRSAAITGKNRQDRNIDTAKREFAQAQDDFDRTFNPTDYSRRRSGRVMPLGGRAGMANLYRPQYNADMNQSITADEDVLRDKKSLASANSLEAERNHAMGWLKGSEQHRAKLEKSIDDYDREIAKLKDEIAMSEAGDPMYDLAVMRMVMNDDMSLMNDIRGRISKKIDQEFQMKQKKADQEFQHEENELNRESTKEDQENAKIKDAEDSYEGALMFYNWAKEDLELNKDPAKTTELKRRLEKAEDTLRTAARKAKKLDDYRKIVGMSSSERDQKSKMVELFLRSKGITGGLEGFKNVYDKTLKTPEERQAFLKEASEFGLDASDFGMPGEEAVQKSAAASGKKFTKEQTAFKTAIEGKTYGTLGIGGKYVFTSADKQAIADDKAKAKSLGLTMTDPDPANGKATISK